VKRTGVIAGAFNPVTRAHVALAAASRGSVDEIVWVVPRALPHKPLEGASLDDRLEMLRRSGAGDRVYVSEGGLYVEIAREIRAQTGSEVYLICGRDAAERILTWSYDDPATLDRMFEEFQLLVAGRSGAYAPPPHVSHRVRELTLNADYDEISSSEIRRRIAAREPWEHLVPEGIVEMVARIYRGR
jgi:nicotinate-nucleotide adenylyltransferase